MYQYKCLRCKNIVKRGPAIKDGNLTVHLCPCCGAYITSFQRLDKIAEPTDDNYDALVNAILQSVIKDISKYSFKLLDNPDPKKINYYIKRIKEAEVYLENRPFTYYINDDNYYKAKDKYNI